MVKCRSTDLAVNLPSANRRYRANAFIARSALLLCHDTSLKSKNVNSILSYFIIRVCNFDADIDPNFASAPSRPGEFHPEPLTEPDVSLSIHPARAIARRLPPSTIYRALPVVG